MRRVPANRSTNELCFFVTTSLSPRRPLFAIPDNARVVVSALRYYRIVGAYSLIGYVVMPDHIHFIARMLGSTKVSGIVRRLKTSVSHSLGIGPIWNRGYWSEVVSTEELLKQKLNYIHQNPVRAQLVSVAENYEFSSARDIMHDDYWTVEPLNGYPYTPLT